MYSTYSPNWNHRPLWLNDFQLSRRQSKNKTMAKSIGKLTVGLSHYMSQYALGLQQVLFFSANWMFTFNWIKPTLSLRFHCLSRVSSKQWGESRFTLDWARAAAIFRWNLQRFTTRPLPFRCRIKRRHLSFESALVFAWQALNSLN